MTKRIFVLLIMLGFTAHHSIAQKDLVHYYIQVFGKDSNDYKVTLGVLDYNEKYYPVKRPIPELTLDSFAARIASEIEVDSTSKIVNLFIHGIWAESPKVWEQMVQSISEDVLDNSCIGRKIGISIIWDSALFYGRGVDVASDKGKYLASFFANFLTSTKDDFTTNIMCHSMGNRVFQHMLVNGELLNKEEILIKEYVSIAADLESDIFDENEPLHKIDNIVDRITIYMHNNDRTLGMSKLINGNKRLGLHGPKNFEELSESFNIVDVSTVTDVKGLPAFIGNHRYFYTSQTIKEDLKRLLWDEDYFKNKIELGSKRKLKLIQE